MRARVRPTMKLFFLLACTAGPSTARAQVAGATGDVAPVWFTSAPRIDGVLDDSVWSAAARIALPFETAPGNNTAARVTTMCRIGYDAEALYIGCEAEDATPSRIRSVLGGRDSYAGQDAIQLLLDPFGQARRAYSFYISPHGVQSDGVFDQEAGTYDLTWDAIWNSAGQVTRSGYAVEAAIPFKSIRFPSRAGGRRWGFQLVRAWPRTAAYWMSSTRIDPALACALCQMQSLVGMEAIASGSHTELAPTFTALRAQDRATLDAPFGRADFDADAGIDARWSPTSGVTLNATLNPDFSQVEADALQLDANARFALTYPERRPFFQEGADMYTTLSPAVATRSIADPVAGVKLTAAFGSTAAGVLLARDAVTQLVLPQPDASTSALLPGHATVLLARLRHQLSDRITIGGLMTERHNGEYFNRLGAIDLYARPLAGLSVRAQLTGTRTRYPQSLADATDRAGTTFGGSAFRTVVRYDTRNWSGQSTYSIRDFGYRADAGFEPQVGIDYVDAWLNRHIWGTPGRWFTKLTFGAGIVRDETWDDLPLEHWQFVSIAYEGPRQTRLSVFYRMSDETFAGMTHDVTSIRPTLSVEPTRWLSGRVAVIAGHAIDYRTNRRARNLQLSPAMTVRFGPHLNVNLTRDAQRLVAGDELLLDANVTRLRAEYHLNARTMARAILLRRSVERPAATPGTRVKELSIASQLLFSYRVNPQTALYFGYGDSWIDHETDLASAGLQQTARRLYVKIGYAWRP